MTGDIAWPEDRMAAVEAVEKAVREKFGVSGADIRRHGCRAGIAKAVAVELCCRLAGKTQREVARHFGYGSDGAAGKQRKLLASKLGSNPDLARTLARIEAVVAASKSCKKTGR